MGLNGIVQEGQRITLFDGLKPVSVVESSRDVRVSLCAGPDFRDCGKLDVGDRFYFPSVGGQDWNTTPIDGRYVSGNTVTYTTKGGGVFTLMFEGIDMDAMLAEDRITDYNTVGRSDHMVPPFPKSL